jgi:hypothetical protein
MREPDRVRHENSQTPPPAGAAGEEGTPVLYARSYLALVHGLEPAEAGGAEEMNIMWVVLAMSLATILTIPLWREAQERALLPICVTETVTGDGLI